MVEPLFAEGLTFQNDLADAELGEIQARLDFVKAQTELERAKGHVKGSLALSLEDSNSRMSRLGRNELVGMTHYSVDEVVEKIEAVTAQDTVEVAAEVYSGPFVLGAVGPFEPDELESYVA